VNTVSGWESRRMDWVPFYQCPDCGDCVDFLFSLDGVLIECSGCQKRFPGQEFKEIKRKRSVVTCVCGRDVSLSPSNRGWLGYICSKCHNYVAICYGNQALQPSTILSFDWNLSVCERGEEMTQDGKLLFTLCRSAKDFLVLHVLQTIIQKEDVRFRYVRPEEHRAGLLLDSAGRKYLGFLAWVEGKRATLGQMFIVKDERRKGYAERMLTHWVERHADRLDEKFGIEDPNEAAMSLLVKLGHVRAEDDRHVGIKCFFAPPGI